MAVEPLVFWCEVRAKRPVRDHIRGSTILTAYLQPGLAASVEAPARGQTATSVDFVSDSRPFVNSLAVRGVGNLRRRPMRIRRSQPRLRYSAPTRRLAMQSPAVLIWLELNRDPHSRASVSVRRLRLSKMVPGCD
jgi:hypothetical protein